MKPAIKQAVKYYFTTTTLHGFKYFYTLSNIDRVGWFLCCCASASCAGMLSAVLWARFLQMPAILTMHSAKSVKDVMPKITICLPADEEARIIIEQYTKDVTIKENLTAVLARVLRKKSVPKDQLLHLEQVFASNNLYLPEVMYYKVPNCNEWIRTCRWLDVNMQCDEFFQKELTPWGVCCVSHPNRLKYRLKYLRITNFNHLTLVLQCSKESVIHGCEFLTQYQGEDWVELETLLPGLYYAVQLSFKIFEDDFIEKLVDGTCIADKLYSRSVCLDQCMEKICGCSNPLLFTDNKKHSLPPCSFTRLSCLWSYTVGNAKCNCLPSCKTIATDMSLESMDMVGVNNTLDPIYVGVNSSMVTLLNIRIDIEGSRILISKPTETWFTLLSSLGGVFNMFLGVGLFSALEFLFFLFVKLIIAIIQPSKNSILPFNNKKIKTIN